MRIDFGEACLDHDFIEVIEAIAAAHDLIVGLPFGLNEEIVIGKADVWADEDQHS
jgi:hypothetical protein